LNGDGACYGSHSPALHFIHVFIVRLCCVCIVQISPDITPEELDTLLEVVMSIKHRASKRTAINGLIVSNTTTTRPKDLQSDAIVTAQAGERCQPANHCTRTNTKIVAQCAWMHPTMQTETDNYNKMMRHLITLFPATCQAD
jgi:hypothetical protein